MPRTQSKLLVVGALLALTLVLALRCRRESPPGEQVAAPGAPAPAGASTVTVKGSDTMVILGQRWAEEYMKRNPGVTVQVTGGGSGTGISALINGTTDIASSSRTMKTAEKTQVSQKAGADAVEIPVAKDGVSVYVHKDNPIAEITFDQLKGIYTGKIAGWKEVGGKDQKIVIYSRENSSGTYVFFKEHVLGGTDFAPTAQTLPGTAAVANAISKDRGGIGYGGIAYGEGIKLLPVKRSTGDKAVPVSKETIADGSYPLSRPLYFYSRGQPLGAPKAFIDWTLSEEGQGVVEKVGYFPLR
jgi:phosphate transport system substrate-binding protein